MLALLVGVGAPVSATAAEPFWEGVEQLSERLYQQISNASRGRPVERVAVLDFVNERGVTSRFGRCLAQIVGRELSARGDGSLQAVPSREIDRAFSSSKAKKKGWRTSADVRPDQLGGLGLHAQAGVMGRARALGSNLDLEVQAYSMDNAVSLGIASIQLADDPALQMARSGVSCPRRAARMAPSPAPAPEPERRAAPESTYEPEALSPPRAPAAPTTFHATQEDDQFRWEAQGCTPNGQNLVCHFRLTNVGPIRDLTVYGGSLRMFDELGQEFGYTRGRFANKEFRGYAGKHRLITNVPITFELYFDGAGGAKRVTALEARTTTALLTFTDLPVHR